MNLWCIKTSSGWLHHGTVSSRRADAIADFLDMYSNAANPKYKKWSYHYKRGTRAVKIKITEVTQ